MVLNQKDEKIDFFCDFLYGD